MSNPPNRQQIPDAPVNTMPPRMDAPMPSGPSGTNMPNRETTLPMMAGASDFGRDMPGQGGDAILDVMLDPKFTSGHDAR